jgi:hypothetical protein
MLFDKKHAFMRRKRICTMIKNLNENIEYEQ